MMQTLLHICCAPCSNMCIETLRGEGIEPVGFWYNPNIHPFTEYRSRRNCLRDYSAAIGLRLIERNDYGLRPFVRAVADDIDGRCVKCYAMRFEAAAELAARGGRAGGVGPRGAVPLPRFPPLFPGGPAARPGPGLLYAEILRLRLLRGGALSQAVKDPEMTARPSKTDTTIP